MSNQDIDNAVSRLLEKTGIDTYLSPFQLDRLISVSWLYIDAHTETILQLRVDDFLDVMETLVLVPNVRRTRYRQALRRARNDVEDIEKTNRHIPYIANDPLILGAARRRVARGKP